MWQGLRLEAKGLSCNRGGRPIFQDLNFVITSGQLLELRGPNGSGKSSLLRLLAGLNAPTSGTLQFDPAQDSTAELCHYVGHQEAIKPALSVQHNIVFWQKFLGGAGALPLETFHLGKLKNDAAGLLSEGQRRRLALSRLSAISRPLWLLDEPSVGLDHTTLQDLKTFMHSHLSQGGMIIAATHAELGLADAQVLNLGGRN